MNTAPIFQVCRNDPAVHSALWWESAPDGPELKLYMFGMAPQNVQKPYAVWQVVGGLPENYLAGRPDTERHSLQVDVYANSASQARSVLAAIEHAIELNCYVTRYGGESKDPETGSYRSSMDVDWHTYR